MRYRININYTFDLGHALKKAQKAIADYTQNGQPVPVKLTAECDRLKRAENALDFRGYGKPRIKGLRAFMTALQARKA